MTPKEVLFWSLCLLAVIQCTLAFQMLQLVPQSLWNGFVLWLRYCWDALGTIPSSFHHRRDQRHGCAASSVSYLGQRRLCWALAKFHVVRCRVWLLCFTWSNPAQAISVHSRQLCWPCLRWAMYKPTKVHRKFHLNAAIGYFGAQVLMANWAPPCRVLVDNVSEWCPGCITRKRGPKPKLHGDRFLTTIGLLFVPWK